MEETSRCCGANVLAGKSSRIWDAAMDGVEADGCHMMAPSGAALKNLGEMEEKEQKKTSW